MKMIFQQKSTGRNLKKNSAAKKIIFPSMNGGSVTNLINMFLLVNGNPCSSCPK